jgi:CO/xanthine dehydrogenase Mo-binding subunit
MENQIGHSKTRIDALEKVTGQAGFPGDASKPGMAHMQLRFAHQPHARIQSIDLSAARAAPGVLAILTADDVPVNDYGLGAFDQAVLCGDVVRYVGDVVAAVIAESDTEAAAARDLIMIEYQPLPVIGDPQSALLPGASPIHADKENNLACSYQVRKGDVDKAFENAACIVESKYEMAPQEHAYLQPDAGIAWLEGDQIVIQCGGQWPHEDQRQIAHCLDIPAEKITVRYPYVGGAFGGREDATVQILLALGTLKVERPVRMIWTREETTIGHHKRHACWISHRWAADEDGKILAQKTDILFDAGAYMSSTPYVLASTVLHSTGPYEVPNVWIDARAAYTNNPPGGAFRGFGVPQAAIGAELQIGRIAEELGIDPVEIRRRNLLTADAQTHTQAPVPPGLSALETLEAAAQAAGWRDEGQGWERPAPRQASTPGKLHGLGFASGWKNVGFTLGDDEKASAVIELHGSVQIEKALVRLLAAEVGQGIATTVRQMAAQALKLPLEKIELVPADTAEGPSAGSVSASRMVFMAGNVVIGAADAALKAWHQEERPAVGDFTYRSPRTEPLDPVTGKGYGAFANAYLAQVAEVEVDPTTGEVKVLCLYSAHDVGKAINPQVVVGQIHGGAVQGLGYAMMENFLTAEGEVQTQGLSTYLIPTVLDVPDRLEPLVIEKPQPIGPFGATGVGEMPLLAVAPAILAAVHNATGVWFSKIPLTPERVLAGLKAKLTH